MIIQRQSQLKKLALGTSAIVALTFTSVASAQGYVSYPQQATAPVYNVQPSVPRYYQPLMRPVQQHAGQSQSSRYGSPRYIPVQQHNQPVYRGQMPAHIRGMATQRYPQHHLNAHMQRLVPVSYTHLTLPTICSV